MFTHICYPTYYGNGTTTLWTLYDCVHYGNGTTKLWTLYDCVPSMNNSDQPG